MNPYIYRGVVVADVDISHIDVNQCDMDDDDDNTEDVFFNIFRGTHKCPNSTRVILEIRMFKLLLTRLEHMSSPLVFSGVRVAQSLVFCVVLYGKKSLKISKG